MMEKPEVISLNGRNNPMVSIVGKTTDKDQKFVSVVDLGDIDKNRTKGADAAYHYLNGDPGKFRTMTTTPASSLKILIYTISVFGIGIAVTIFAMNI